MRPAVTLLRPWEAFEEVEDSAVQCEQIFDIEQEHMSRRSHDQFLSELVHASFVVVVVRKRGGGGGGG